ncbi:EAL domain-containing protein [Cytobacillus depressus]|uniref:EAL domain-containing protein n=1 Tax=Cytobacillus depressus TaxID=1602942 RepID=UPI001478CDED|nr:EAL domain-containing protein [Cytobacillus depressus]
MDPNKTPSKPYLEIADPDVFYRAIFENNPDTVFFLNPEGIIVMPNKGFTEILGYSEDEIAFISIEEIIYISELPFFKVSFNEALTGNVKHFDTVFIQKGGISVQIDLTLIPAKFNGQVIGVSGIAKDVTERKKSEELNKYLAYNDSLTDLPNRRFFHEKLENELIISKTLQQKFAIMYLDLDRFKYINDTLGHFVGDKLLIQISKRLKICLGERNLLARLGGDEFSVLIPDLKSADQVIDLAKTIIESLEDPFFIEGYQLFITTSIGISIYPTDGEDIHTLLKNADSALYKSKESGKSNYHIYTSSMNIQTYKTFSLESGLRNAIELNQFEFYYQPKVCSRTNQIVGVEALIRWNHPEWGLLSPDEFIPLAEEIGLIAEIGKWVKYQACSQNKAWQDAGLPAIPISINISPLRFLEKNLVKNIISVLEETKLDPEYLEIEITETSVLENEKVVLSTLDELKSIGVRISLDDFGTGYSSLSYLKLFKGRINALKIDRSFIKDLSEKDPDGSNFITKTIIELAQHLKMNVVAEGVENTEQLQILKHYNCETIQGYLFSKPVPADEFAVLLGKGKIEVSGNHAHDTKNQFEDKREYFRINLDFPLSASMTLIRIYGRKVELGKTNVLIEDIGLGGLRFLSDIRLSVHRDIILEFETEILGETIKMYGSVVWMNEIKAGIYQYGLEFLVEENERLNLAKLLNKFAILLRKNPLVPNCNFAKVDRYQFFRNK